MRALLVVTLALAACSKPDAPKTRASLVRTGGTTFQVVPSEGQHPYCLLFTVSQSGLTRQLTMSSKNQAFSCPAGAPVGKRTFKVPRNEGPVKVYAFFFTQPVNAGALAQDILEAKDRQALSVMDMRLPGQASLETLRFEPEDDVAPEVGGLLGGDAGASDAGPVDAEGAP